MLVRIPYDRTAERVAKLLAMKMESLPEFMRKSVTWDQGKEMARHVDFSVATGIDVYFCDPHSPWQRGTNENTNGLLRQYFPKGTDLSLHSQADLDKVAEELNGRPRKTLGWQTPVEVFAGLLESSVSLLPLESAQGTLGVILEGEVTIEATDDQGVVLTTAKVPMLPCRHASVVLYSSATLLENGGVRSGDFDWEIVAVTAGPWEKEPMMPLTMARNLLSKPGGTKATYSAEQLAESIYHWAGFVQARPA